jgi:Domain of unknown function (DUF4349)
MQPLREDQLIAELRTLRPTPRPEYVAKLDQRAAAGFPRRAWTPRLSFDRLRVPPARRLLLPAGGVALVAIAIATAVVVSNGGGSEGALLSRSPGGASPDARPAPRHFDGSGGRVSKSAAGSEVQLEAQAEALTDSGATAASNLGFRPHHRAVERSAEIVLAAEPADVADDAARVFEALHANRGIVMRSSTQQGPAGEAGARFELLIPSARLGDALAAFSAIDEVRARHEATADITAPTVTASELLRDSRARIDSLLAQLEAAETESEREAVEAELRHERRHAARLAAQLDRLQRRAELSRVSLRIVTGEEGESSGGGPWGIDDALGDAGRVLAVAASVTLVGLAVLGPIALIALLAWLTHRAWIRRERRRVLG